MTELSNSLILWKTNNQTNNNNDKKTATLRACALFLSLSLCLSLSLSLTHTHTHTHTDLSRKRRKEVFKTAESNLAFPYSAVQPRSYDNRELCTAKTHSNLTLLLRLVIIIIIAAFFICFFCLCVCGFVCCCFLFVNSCVTCDVLERITLSQVFDRNLQSD